MFKRKNKRTRIVPNQDFLDGSERFSKGVTYRVDIARARYFERNGWLEGSDQVPMTSPDLDIHYGNHGHEGSFYSG